MNDTTITSRRPCPVCGGRRWYPLSIYTTERLAQADPAISGMDVAVVDVDDTEFARHEFYDECARCCTVVTG